MVYGRVIGNELRDVPPEYLPIWGQRWSGYRAPHGPSPFSTRIFSADRMSEVGPVLTSPTQFEMTLTEEDEGEDASPESSQFRSSFLSSPLAIQADAAEPTSRPEIPMPRSVHPSSDHPHDSPNMLHRSPGHPRPQTSTCSAMLLPRQQSTPIQAGHGPLENNYTLWNMDCTSTSIQLQTNHSHPSHSQSGQLEHTTPHSTPEWQLANTHTQSSAYPFQLNPSSQPGSGCFLLPFQADDQTTTSPSSSNSFTIPFPQQSVAINPPRDESSITMIPGVAHPRYPMMPPWPQGSTLPNPSFSGPLQNSGSPEPGVFYHLVSDHHEKSTCPENFLGTSAHAEGCTLLSLDKPGAWSEQFTR